LLFLPPFQQTMSQSSTSALSVHSMPSSPDTGVESPLKCPHCFVHVANQRSLKEHIVDDHYFPCHHVDCHHVFPSIHILNKHEDDRHSGQLEMEHRGTCPSSSSSSISISKIAYRTTHPLDSHSPWPFS